MVINNNIVVPQQLEKQNKTILGGFHWSVFYKGGVHIYIYYIWLSMVLLTDCDAPYFKKQKIIWLNDLHL